MKSLFRVMLTAGAVAGLALPAMAQGSLHPTTHAKAHHSRAIHHVAATTDVVKPGVAKPATPATPTTQATVAADAKPATPAVAAVPATPAAPAVKR